MRHFLAKNEERRAAPRACTALVGFLALAPSCESTPSPGPVADAAATDSAVVPPSRDAAVDALSPDARARCEPGFELPLPSARVPATVSFREELMPLFVERCNFGGCHLGRDEPGHLRLGDTCVFDPATSTCRVADAGIDPDLVPIVHGNLLGAALAAPRLARVEPGQPAESFILYKLSGCQEDFPERTGCSDCGNPMPPGAPLRESAPDAYALVFRWIEEGAALD